jgi:hypothetical protein
MKNRLLIILALFAAVGHFSCDESVPAYVQPENILVSTITFEAPDTISVYYDPLRKLYALNDRMNFQVSIKNNFDDLLQGTAKVEGGITVQSFSEAPRLMLVTLTKGDLRTPPVFQGNIAVAPTKSADFSVLWYPLAVDKKMPFDELSFTMIDGERLYGPIKFQAYAVTQIFERLQPVRSNTLEFERYFLVKE